MGITFDVSNIRPDGDLEPETSMDTLNDHIEHIVDVVGVDYVGFGSDFDGATVSSEIGDVAEFPRLLGRLQARGFTDTEVRKIAMENWLRVLDETWH